MKGYQYQSEFAKKYVAQGIEQGIERGIAQGEAMGRAEAAARAVLTVLRVRGIAVSDASRERILAQRDLELLERWLEKASVADSLADMLEEPS